MALEHFRDWNPNAPSRVLVATCNEIIDELSDYRLTLRQLYYQLVSRNIIPNKDRAYKNLGNLLTRARLAGLVDWDAIEDRVRRPDLPTQFNGLEDLVRAALASYRLPRWDGQDCYCELWVEKDALASVLRPLARKYHVTLMVNRGYSSASAMKESADRFINAQAMSDEYLRLALFYLGDLDPSGEDMVRDIGARLDEFGVEDLHVEKIALTYAQVQHYKPPPNPAKLTDSRAPAFVAKYGIHSWEVDALSPPILTQLISDAIEEVFDDEMMDEIKKREKVDKKNLIKAVKGLS